MEEPDIIVINNKYCCRVCNKQYTNKSSLVKHKLLCDFKAKTEREKTIEFEEVGDMPNQVQLVKIVQELALKVIKLEQKIEEMQKYVDKKKKKINVIEWLNTNINPNIGFLEWVNVSLTITPEHFHILMENTLFYTIQKVFEDNLVKSTDFIYPIYAFSQKSVIFYICEKKEISPNELKNEWRQMTLQDMVILLKTLQNRMIKELTKWKLENQQLFQDDAKLSTTFSKSVIKLMGITYTQDATMSKIKNSLFNYLKVDFKNMIEYEFEF
jgi:hypothetical protein